MFRLFNLFAYRVPYKRHRAVMHALYTALFVFVVITFIILSVTIKGEESKVLNAFSMAFGILDALLMFAVIIYSRILAVSKAEYDNISEHFENTHFVYNETIIRSFIQKRLRRKKARGALCVMEIKGLTNIRNIFGQEGIKVLNDTICDVLSRMITDNKNYAYGFSNVKGWLIYKKTKDVESYLDEIREIVSEINAALEKEGRLTNVAILCGVYFAKGRDKFYEVYSKAQVASTYNIQSRIVSDALLYDPEEMTDREGERNLSNELGNALSEQQLQIFYQPKYDLHEKNFFGAEALIRWNHPNRGLVPPSLFIPFAEQSGKIVEIDKYVFESVCRDMAKWKREGKRILKVSINLSRKTALDKNILSFYQSVMDKYDIDPKYIDIELTESMAAQDAVFVSSMIRKIKAMNVETSIDDFGTGYSSLNTLKKMPFDTLKIDKSFVDEVELDQKSRDLLRCINDMAHSLGMKTICEGIETEGQVNIVEKLGVDYIQGYYFSKPLSEFEFQRFINNNDYEKIKEKMEVKA